MLWQRGQIMFVGEGQQADNLIGFLLSVEGLVKGFLKPDSLTEVLFKTIESEACW